MYNTWGMGTFGDTLAGHTFLFGHTHFNQLLHSIMSDLNDAADTGDLERVQVLVEQGVDKDKVGHLGVTPLWAASRKGHLTVVTFLVEQGADIEKAEHGWTPLIIASTCGHIEVVRYLLDQGANRDNTTVHRWTSLHFAARDGHLEIAKLLMAYGADLNVRTYGGRLPIDCARNVEIRQAIRDESERRRDQQPRKRCVEEVRHPNAAASASAKQEADEEVEQNSKQPAGGEVEEGLKLADEDQDSEPSSDEDEN